MIIGWLNVGLAGVGAEAPIKGLPMDSRVLYLNARIRRQPLSWGFHLNVDLTDVEL